MKFTDAKLKREIINGFFYSQKDTPALSHSRSREEFDHRKVLLEEKFADKLKDFDYMAERVWLKGLNR